MRRRTTPKFWLFMILTTVVVFSVSLGVLQARYGQGARELERIRDHRDDLDLEVRDLRDELEYAQTDDFIIRAARDQLGLIMPSEVRYVNGAR
ncbi:MAG: septum formation initiator family protein [Clostridia bacterium]|nr:septum formation initiator family protein [Clostridia bacterium]